MRVTVGTIAVLGLAVAVAAAQPPRERAAELKPPQALRADELPPVARGAIDDFPSSALPSTPVTRPNAPASRPGVAGGPAWLTGNTDPNVQPASGLNLRGGGVRTLTPPVTQPKDDPVVQPKFIDRLKGAVTGEKRPTPQPQQPAAQPQQPEQPTAGTPFRGTGTNGAPVYAGPPAYRWYGWGTVTPGANPLAPTGQYPKASANWYNITGATPGAFPVPVGTPARMPSGTEPPNYGLAARVPVVPAAAPQPSIQYTERPVTPPAPTPPPAGSKFAPGTGAGIAVPPPMFTPTPTPPAPVGVPVITAPPMPKPVSPVVVAPPAPRPEPKPDHVAALPPVPAGPAVPPPLPPLPSVKPVMPVAPPVTPAPAAEPVKLPVPVPVTETKSAPVPSPLPTSVTNDPPREELRWQQAKEPATPAPGTWAPAPGAEPLRTMPPGEAGAPVGRAAHTPTVARGQMNDRSPDPIATLIKQVCQGRAEGVEVRYTGTKKLQVCFEVRTAPEARKLVDDISRRPELTAYQIDFCVLVK